MLSLLCSQVQLFCVFSSLAVASCVLLECLTGAVFNIAFLDIRGNAKDKHTDGDWMKLAKGHDFFAGRESWLEQVSFKIWKQT